MQPFESTPASTPTRGATLFFQPEGDDQRRLSRKEMDDALAVLQQNKAVWARTGIRERITILDQILQDLAVVADRWVAACMDHKGIDPSSSRAGEEWSGVVVVMRLVRLLRNSLRDVAARGRPIIPGPITAGPEGQIVAGVFPQSPYDRVFFPGVTAEVWLDPKLERGRFEQAHAAQCQPKDLEGKVAFVLGAGNFSSLGPLDILYKLFSEHQVVVFKPNPVLEYMGPILARAFRALIDRDVLRIVYGGREEGAYLASHPLVDELHITGSDKTYEAIVFGGGVEGQRRKAAKTPLLAKRFTCELGNVSPTIVVPGPWCQVDLDYQGEHLASTLTFNGGFNCLSTRVIVQHRSWNQRRPLLSAIRRVFSNVPPRKAYYPGAQEIHDYFLRAHPEAEQYGQPLQGTLPWTLIPNLDPEAAEEPCFSTEPFCSLFAETGIEAASVPEFIDRAVDFVNERLWGTLTATILVHPRSMRIPQVAAAVQRAVANLRYGTVGVNMWGVMGYLMSTTSWGAFPGHPSHDIQSGHGVINNVLMLPDVQKSVLRAPFAQWWPKPPQFVSHKTANELFKQFVDFERDPSPGKLPGLVWAAVRG